MYVRVTFVGGACGSQGQGDVRGRWVESCRWSLCKRVVGGAYVNERWWVEPMLEVSGWSLFKLEVGG